MSTTKLLIILIAATALSVALNDWCFLPFDLRLLHDWQTLDPSYLGNSALVVGSVLTIIGFLVALKLSGGARFIAAIQIWAAALLITFLIRDFILCFPLPSCFLSSIAIGMFAASMSLDFHKDIAGEHDSVRFSQELQNKDLIEARLELIKQDEVDRRMLAADLHDQVLNDLKTLRQEISDLKSLTADDAKRLDQLVNRSMSGVRDVMDNLSPVDIEHLGLTESLRSCVEKAGERGGVSVSFESSAAAALDSRLSKIEATLLYRLVQESTNNILKHAGAEKIMGQVREEDGDLIVRIVDDGRGIESDKFASESRGMRYMRLRADLIGATLAWKARKSGSGTIVEIRFQSPAELIAGH